jgi:hypothetical protein
VEFALGDCSISEETGRHSLPVLQLVGQCQTHSNGQAAADDGVPTVEAATRVEKVH